MMMLCWISLFLCPCTVRSWMRSCDDDVVVMILNHDITMTYKLPRTYMFGIFP